MKKAKQTKTFITFREIELYDVIDNEKEVADRNVGNVDFEKLTGYHPVVESFRFFDADVTVKKGQDVRGKPHNYSPEYRIAGAVMSIEDYKKREEPKLEIFKRDKASRLGSFAAELADGSSNLKRAFKSALGARRPLFDWYIKGVENALKTAKKTGATHVALRSGSDELALPTPISANTIVVNKDMKQLYPLPPSKAAPPRKPGL
ncbi:MAG: hypothetical protein OXT65_04200 [Alphaproteobacteria bacterium]|nr:hypothetical protein [Alphaproteobacteria bacterium]